MEQPNWIPDVNRFSLAEPPSWWLRKLKDFDSSLVVIPSRQSPVYRLSQRRVLDLPAKIVNEALFKESDTQMLASYSLIPVTTIIANPHWDNPFMFQELAARAPWRQGGAENVIKRIEADEAVEDLNKKLYIESYLNSLGKDAWGLYNKKIGVRSHMYIPRKKESIVRSKAPAIRVK